MGEGPAHDVAATMRTVRVDGPELQQRWPRYGPVVAGYRVGSLISVRLRREPGGWIGALSVYDTAPAVTADTAAASVRIADAFIHTVLNASGVIPDDRIPAVPMFDEADFSATVHQAAASCRPNCTVGRVTRSRCYALGRSPTDCR